MSEIRDNSTKIFSTEQTKASLAAKSKPRIKEGSGSDGDTKKSPTGKAGLVYDTIGQLVSATREEIFDEIQSIDPDVKRKTMNTSINRLIKTGRVHEINGRVGLTLQATETPFAPVKRTLRERMMEMIATNVLMGRKSSQEPFFIGLKIDIDHLYTPDEVKAWVEKYGIEESVGKHNSIQYVYKESFK